MLACYLNKSTARIKELSKLEFNCKTKVVSSLSSCNLRNGIKCHRGLLTNETQAKGIFKWIMHDNGAVNWLTRHPSPRDSERVMYRLTIGVGYAHQSTIGVDRACVCAHESCVHESNKHSPTVCLYFCFQEGAVATGLCTFWFFLSAKFPLGHAARKLVH